MEFVDQTFSRCESEGAGSDANRIIQRGIPCDHVFIVDGERGIRCDRELHDVAEAGDEHIALALCFHDEQSAGSAKERLADLLTLHDIGHAAVTGQECAGVQPVLLSCADRERDDLARHGRCDPQPSGITASLRLGDEERFPAGQRTSDRAEHAADPFLVRVHLAGQFHIGHIRHAAAFDAYGLIPLQTDLNQRTVGITNDRIIHVSFLLTFIITEETAYDKRLFFAEGEICGKITVSIKRCPFCEKEGRRKGREKIGGTL